MLLFRGSRGLAGCESGLKIVSQRTDRRGDRLGLGIGPELRQSHADSVGVCLRPFLLRHVVFPFPRGLPRWSSQNRPRYQYRL